MPRDLRIPQLSNKTVECTVTDWLKREGDRIQSGEPVVLVEAEKVSIEVTSDVNGVLAKILVPRGTVVKSDQVLAIIGELGESVSLETPSQSLSVQLRGPLEESSLTSEAVLVKRRPASPAARRVAKELAIDLTTIVGSGPDGLVTERDVRAWAVSRISPAFEEDESIPYVGIRRDIGEHLARSRRTAADVTTVIQVDMTEVSILRKDIGVSYVAVVAKAAANALKSFPLLNSTLQGDKICLKKRINLGVAVAVDDAVMVPVVRDANRLTLVEVNREIDRLAERARKKELAPEDMRDGTFTVTNSGAFGTLLFTPIINHPEAAILGIGKVEEVPTVRDHQVVIRLVMYLCLSYDHRIIDGAMAAHFLQRIKQLLESPNLLDCPDP
jgi:pyruvate/2-oxoglutarate dehydrogenase complex dihydrolipoamide acyltransferase (E2) component